jgi:putative heme transporter
MAVRQTPTVPEATRPAETPQPLLSSHRLVRSGVYAWALIGILVLVAAVTVVVGRLTVVVVPLVVALFPAAVLTPLTRRLIGWRVPPSIAALAVLLLTVGLVTAVFMILAPQVQREIGNVGVSVRQGYTQVKDFLADGPFGLSPIQLDEVIMRAQDQLRGAQGIGATALSFVNAILEGVAELLLFLFALFFYLKDGAKIAGWLRDLFPRAAQADAEHIGGLVWNTIGGYIRGQMFIALVDASLIGIGLLVLGVPLALPLAVFVFFGALFPIVGSIIAGTVAVLVALATGGLGSALLVLALALVVFQLEGHLLSPVVLGRSTRLHPLAVIAALTAGGVLSGVLGAFLAVPIAASAARAVGYLRSRQTYELEDRQPAG